MKQAKTTKSCFPKNLHTYYHFQLDFQKMAQHTEGKWLIYGTKRRKDNQLQNLELSPVEYPSRAPTSHKGVQCNMFNPIFKENVQGREHPGSCAFAEPELLR